MSFKASYALSVEALLIEAQDPSEAGAGALWLCTSLRPCQRHELVGSAYCRVGHVHTLRY